MRLAGAARAHAARRALEPCHLAGLCRWPIQRAAAAASAPQRAAFSTDMVQSSPLSSFKADRKLFAEGLPDLIDHANLYNNPGVKYNWRRGQGALPTDIAMLRRKKAQLVIDRLAHARTDGSLADLAPGLLFTGGAGSGKSMALLNVVHWAKTSGWLVCYVPNAREWTHGAYWEPHPQIPGSMVQTDLVFNFLRTFTLANENLLGSIPLQHDLSFGDSMPPAGVPEIGAKHGHTVADLLEIVPKFNNPEPEEREGTLSVDPRVIFVVEHLKKELYSQTAVPLLVAIDQFNFLFDQSGYRELQGRGMTTPPVPVSRLRLCELFLDFKEDSPANGALVGAVCRGHPRRGDSDKLQLWAGEMQQFRIGRFTPEEALTMLDHWSTYNASSLAACFQRSCVPGSFGTVSRLCLLCSEKSGVMSMDLDATLFARATALTQRSPRELHRFAHRH